MTGPGADDPSESKTAPGAVVFPLLFAFAVVAIVLGGLFVGYEPVGGDPDRLYRPLKSELARSLLESRLPFWSDRFGLGVPLVAESQVAAFYPLNLVLYRLVDVNAAYRWAMLAHYVALAATTYAYARRLALTVWGSTIAAIAFTFCGFQAIHSSHEPFYHAIVYLPLALLFAESYVATGRAAWLALLALTLGIQLTLGHFQIQMWTGGLALLTGFRRIISDRRPWSRGLALGVAVAWGGAIAAVQLGLSWEFARSVGQTERPAALLAFYSFPPEHWAELAVPRFLSGLRGGPEDPYWWGRQTTGYEASLYVGTIPLILAFVGLLDVRRGRGTMPWRLLVPATFALATMPRWWPQGYLLLLNVPGLGYFRCPARYTMLTSLGLALLAGQGLDRAVSSGRFRIGLTLAIVFGAAAAVWVGHWNTRADVRSLAGTAGLPFGIVPAAVSWSAALAVLIAWRRRVVGAWAPCLLAAVELGLLYHASTTVWGWSVALPANSPVLSRLAREKDAGSVGGVLDDLPVRAGLTTASPYLGFTLPPPHPLLKTVLARWEADPGNPVLARWLRRYGVTHVVFDHPFRRADLAQVETTTDQALDQLVYRPAGAPAHRAWSVIRLVEPLPRARLARSSWVAQSASELMERLSREDALDRVGFLSEDAPREIEQSGAIAVRLVDWDGESGIVEHDGPCVLVLTRAFDAGWRVRLNGGPARSVVRADGGLQAIPIPGRGRTQVALEYAPAIFRPAAIISIVTVAVALLVLAGAGIRAMWAARAERKFARLITNS